jgi:hypothetical protein
MRKKNYKYLTNNCLTTNIFHNEQLYKNNVTKNDAIQYLLKKKQTRNSTIIDTYIYVYLKSVSLVAYFRGK